MADSASLDSIHPATPVNQGGGLLSMQQVLDEGPATITVTEVEAQASENPDDTRGPEWMYSKGPRIFGNIWYYASTQVQVALISIICFLEPGLFNAITGLGGAGQIDATAADNANTALYSSFCVFAFLVGPFVNRFGFKWTVFVGTLGYAIYVASFLCYNFTRNDGFVIFGGTNLGACAAILWVAQGGMLTSYPHEEEKGRYVSWFWGVFSLGSFLGALIPLADNHHVTENEPVRTSTYIIILTLMVLGSVIALLGICNADKVRRQDGSAIIVIQHPTLISEFKAMLMTLCAKPWILLLFPMFIASNWFYTYQFNGVNAARFNTRTRTLNNTLYWFGQIVGAFSTGYILDNRRYLRSKVAKLTLVTLFFVTIVVWLGGLAFEINVPGRVITSAPDFVKMDWTNRKYVLPLLLYTLYGFYDAMWQACIYWLMGAITNSSRTAVYLAGFYKAIQSAGAAIAWRLDGMGFEYMVQWMITFLLLTLSLIVATPVIWSQIKDTVTAEEEVAYIKNNVGDALPQRHPIYLERSTNSGTHKYREILPTRPVSGEVESNPDAITPAAPLQTPSLEMKELEARGSETTPRTSFRTSTSIQVSDAIPRLIRHTEQNVKPFSYGGLSVEGLFELN